MPRRGDEVEDVISGCALWLRADPDTAARLAVDVDGQPLIVQDNAPDRAEFAQGVAAVVSHAGFEAPIEHNTWQCARVQVEFWSDPLRDGFGNVDEAPAGARKRMLRAYWALDRRLHRPQGGEQYWGDVRTTDCQRRAGVNPYQVPGADGLWRGVAMYAVGLG